MVMYPNSSPVSNIDDCIICSEMYLIHCSISCSSSFSILEKATRKLALALLCMLVWVWLCRCVGVCVCCCVGVQTLQQIVFLSFTAILFGDAGHLALNSTMSLFPSSKDGGKVGV